MKLTAEVEEDEDVGPAVPLAAGWCEPPNRTPIIHRSSHPTRYSPGG